MNNLMTNLGQGTPLPVDTGALHAAAEEPKTDSTGVKEELRPILSKDSLSITTPGAAEVELQMIEHAHDGAMAIAKNMVDTPEERKAKAERQARIVAQEDDRKDRQEEITEKSIEAAHIQDEISEKREVKV